MTKGLFDWVNENSDQDAAFILVEITATNGSAPREPGAKMAVSRTDFFGTIGGGALEQQALNAARAMLADGEHQQNLSIPLGPEIGMCCGGRVTLRLARLDRPMRLSLKAQEMQKANDRPCVWIYGAGHVGQALARALAPLPLNTHIVDSRQEWLGKAPNSATQTLTAIPEATLAQTKPGDAVVIMTHDHGQDFLLAEAALNRPRLAYTGMIGSTSKRKVLEAQLARTGGPDPTPLTCPIGEPGPNLRAPEVIAALLAADLISKLLKN